MVLFVTEGIDAIHACEQDGLNHTGSVTSNTPLHLRMYTWSNQHIKCNCYVWLRSAPEARLFPSLEANTQYHCNPNDNPTSCYYLNYTVCSFDHTCSHVYKTNDRDVSESGDFTDDGITISRIWYHRILLKYQSSSRELDTIYITCEYCK